VDGFKMRRIENAHACAFFTFPFINLKEKIYMYVYTYLYYVSLVIILCYGLVGRYECFGGTYCLHTFKVEEVYFSKYLVPSYCTITECTQFKFHGNE
jgi:hypothetical protein